MFMKHQKRCVDKVESHKPGSVYRPSHMLSESAIARAIVCCDADLSTFLRYVDDVADGSCM